MLMNISQKTIYDLEWSQLLEHLANRCSSEQGAQYCRSLPFLPVVEAQIRLQLINEFLVCIHNDDSPPALPAEPVDEALAFVRSDGSIPAEALLAIAINLKQFVALCRYLENRRDVCPKNADLVLAQNQDVSPIALARLAAEIESAFEPDGTISDSASRELSQLRKRRISLRQNLLARMDKIAEKNDDILRDRTVTMRNERYVLPVRTDAHKPIAGIVHGSSGTGATTFIEPSEIVEAGNELMLTKEKISREEFRILCELRDAVKEQLEEVSYACGTIVDTDTRIAGARLSWDIDASVPQKAEPGSMELIQARHPLLALENPKVVPCDIQVRPGNTILISGPNAGGKTVILKTVGLFGLMLNAGLPISADGESKAGIPNNVLTDIGDDQSLAAHLSTYSAHMKNIGDIILQAQPGCIVLLDELSAGTDPVEGTALAQSLLDRLNELGATTLATTHFDALKTHAQENEKFTNVAMGFNAKRGLPTYQIHVGLPGNSSALAIAKQYGIPASIIDRAKTLLPEGVRKLANTVEALELEQQRTEEERLALEEQRKSLELTESQFKRELQRIEQQGKRFIDKEAEALWSSIKKAREKVRDVEKSIKRRKMEPGAIQHARKTVNDIADQLLPGAKLSNQNVDSLPGVEATVKNLIPDTQVHIISMNKKAHVDSPVKGNTVYVRVGTVRMRVGMEDLRVLNPVGAKKGPSSSAAKTHSARPVSPTAPLVTGDPIRTDSNTVDLRGKTVDEAIDATDSFLDSAMNGGDDVVFVLHGHGTGALRNAIREYLNNSPYVDRHRPGARNEGGDGMTVVWVR